MNTESAVRKDIVELLAHYFGERIRNAFFEGYAEETLPIYVHTAYQLLVNQIGPEKAHQQITKILNDHNIHTFSYE